MKDELEGVELDAAVAKADGLHFSIERRHPQPMAAVIGPPPTMCWVTGWKIAGAMPFMPSRDWAVGGPIIERERIEISISEREHGWWANLHGAVDLVGVGAWGETPLIAAMRAFVASRTSR